MVNQANCTHRLAWLMEPPYRYICLKCGAKLKIASGIYPTEPKPKQVKP